jgi:hypothetical protein
MMSSFGIECAVQNVITHEWLHQVSFAYHRVSGFDDLYDGAFPGCGQGDPDPKKWFPDSHECNLDPDFESCGQSTCGSNDLVNSHILSVHWDPAFRFFGNHCKNGVQDFEETAIDIGPNCPQGVGVAGVNLPRAVAPITPVAATPTP